MKNKHIFLKYYIKSKYQGRKVSSDNIRTYIKEHIMIANEKIQTAEEINIYIRNLILSGKPFLAGRFGATELSCVRTFDFEVSSKYDKVLSQMKMWSGFFPSEKEMGFNFKNLMMKSIPSADVMGIWMLPFEEYYLNKYGKTDLKTTYLFDLEPWSSPENPWSAALKGKKVLVIHPFAETIKFQYQNRVNLFPGTEILPEFEHHHHDHEECCCGHHHHHDHEECHHDHHHHDEEDDCECHHEHHHHHHDDDTFKNVTLRPEHIFTIEELKKILSELDEDIIRAKGYVFGKEGTLYFNYVLNESEVYYGEKRDESLVVVIASNLNPDEIKEKFHG